ncbi:metal ABC transporter permease [Gammaproteobacteria bacterium]|nr:metal ABC transporter permease [Gammaproteobacteria bacterium]
MIEPFIFRGALAGLGVAIIAGALGCFVVWRRMAYFGDALAHASLLGIAAGLILGVAQSLTSFVFCLLFAAMMTLQQRRQRLSDDTVLGILAHAGLAFGVIAMSLSDNVRFDLESYLFGDILTVNSGDLALIGGGVVVVLILLAINWSSLVLMTVNRDLAIAEGVPAQRVEALLMLMLAIVVAVSIRVVGVLLITSMLIIPAATARLWSRTPQMMAVGAVGCGMLAVVLGLMMSMQLDTPSGPSIISAAALMFFVVSILMALRRD